MKEYEEIYKSDISGINYRYNDYYFELLLKDPDSISKDMKFLLASILEDWLSDVNKQLSSLSMNLSDYVNEYSKSDDRIKYQYAQKLNIIYNDLKYEYEYWKEYSGYWKYLHLFTDNDHCSFKYYFDKTFNGKYNMEEIFENKNFISDFKLNVEWIP